MNLLVKNDDVCRGVGVCNDAIVTVTVAVFVVFVFVAAVAVVVFAVVEFVPPQFSTIKTDVVTSFSFAPHNHWQFSFASLSFNTVVAAELFDGLMLVSDVLGVAQVCTVVHSIDLLE